MLSKLLVSFNAILTEVALWIMFIGALIVGWTAGDYLGTGGGFRGALTSLLATFIFAVLFIAPLLILSDIRSRVKNIEGVILANPGRNASVPVAVARTAASVGGAPSSTTNVTQSKAGGAENRYPYSFKHGGKVVQHDNKKAMVDGKEYSSIDEALSAIDDGVVR